MPDFKVGGINKVRAKGHTYYYHRKTGARICAEWGTAAFLAEVERLNGKIASRAQGAGTLGGLILAYRQSPEWKRLARGTRGDYDRIFNWLAQIAEMPLEQLTSPFVFKLRDRYHAAHGVRSANYLLAVGSLLFNWGEPRGQCTGNPFARVPAVRKANDAPEANRPWRFEEISAAITAATDGMRVAIALGAYVGLRRGDVIAAPRTIYRNGIIDLVTAKRRRHIRIEAPPALALILNNWSASRDDPAITIVANSRGLPYTADGFKASFFRLVRRLEVAGQVDPGCTFHGLRHSVGDCLALAGCTELQIAAAMGITPEASRRYTRRAAQDRLAAQAAEHLATFLQNQAPTLQNRPGA